MAFNSLPQESISVRWRLCNGKVPLLNRHMKALNEVGVGAALHAWLLSRLETSLSEGEMRTGNKILEILIDAEGDVQLQVEELPDTPAPEEVALLIGKDGAIFDAASASVWIRSGESIVTPPAFPARPRGSRSLVYDLTKTLKYDIEERTITPDEIEAADEAFLVSDIFGVILLEDRGGELSRKLADGFTRLWGTAT